MACLVNERTATQGKRSHCPSYCKSELKQLSNIKKNCSPLTCGLFYRTERRRRRRRRRKKKKEPRFCIPVQSQWKKKASGLFGLRECIITWSEILTRHLPGVKDNTQVRLSRRSQFLEIWIRDLQNSKQKFNSFLQGWQMRTYTNKLFWIITFLNKITTVAITFLLTNLSSPS